MANIPLKTIKFPDLDDTYTIPSKTSDLTNDSGYVTASTAPVTSVNGQTGAVTGLQTTANLVTSMTSSSTNTQYPSAKAVYDALQAAGGVVLVEIGSTISDTRWNEIVAAAQAGKIVIGYYDYEESPGPGPGPEVN